MKNNIKELKQRALNGDLTALEELRQLGVLSGNKLKYTMAPVSFAQKRLWFIDKMDKSPAYNLPAALILEGDLNIEAFEKAFNDIIKRHEILRTVFVETDGITYQKIYNELKFTIVVNDLIEDADKDRKTKKIIAEEVNRIFDLTKGPLIVYSLIKLENQKYILLFNMHHIISDGWSIGVLISELTVLYNSYSAGADNPLPPLKIQYKDYVDRHSQMLNEENISVHKNYWLNKYKDEIPVSEISPDLIRPTYKTFNGRKYDLCIDKSIHNKIKELCKKNNASLFMFIISSVNILINKYSGKNDIVVGSPVSGRELRDLENQIGFYVNTIPLRTEVNTANNFNEFFAYVKQNCIEAYDHQMYPFDLMIEELNLERDTSRNPLFEIMVSLQEANADKINLDGIKTTVIKPETTFSKFDLHFNFEENENELWLGIIYNPDLYKPESIERLGKHFNELLKNILNRSTEPISKYEIITEDEKKLIVEVFNNTSCYYPKEKTIAQLFREVAEKYPDKPAVVYQGKELTYKMLNDKSDNLAYNLINDYSLQLDEPVVVIMNSSHELIISMLGILKAGGAYLPIDVDMPADRINTILKDVTSRILLTANEVVNDKYSVPNRIHIDEKYLSQNKTHDKIITGKSSSNLAYILYTSGSTGTPKGSMIEEKSVLRLVRNTNYIDLDSSCNIFSASSISFDATTLDIWGALLNGGTLYFEKTEDYLDPEKLASYLEKYKINILLMPTGFYARMADTDMQFNMKMFKNIKTLVVGGDKLPCRISNEIRKIYPSLTLLNAYGPTENTAITTVYHVNKDFQSDIPVGKLISNTTAYILNECGNLCPIGVMGELYIGGEGLSRGYVNRPDMNKQKFVRSPFNQNEILYRSGDICKWCDDGNIIFIGRNDDQLKIRGFRIETGEIENISSKYPGVINTKVLVVQEEDQKELALYYTAKVAINNEELKNYISKTLPAYMIPKYYLCLSEFPLNQNGKVNYKAFPKPENKLEKHKNIYEVQNATEKTLIAIYETILNVRNVSIKDNFFSLGGHSLKAIKAVSAIQKELSVKVSLKEFFASPEIISLEKIIRSKKKEELGEIPAVKQSDYYNMSHAQKRLWVLDKIEKTKATYNIPLALTVYDEIDVDAMQSAYDDMLKRHEALRTLFVEINGEPFQKIINDGKNLIIIRNFSLEHNPDESAFKFIVEESHKEFILSEYPLIRFYVLKIAEKKYIIFINIHHIICDGWSLNIMTDELFGFYKNYITNKENLFEIPQIQYKDYACWLNDKVNNPENESDRAYWIDKLKGEIVPLDMPSDYRRPAIKTHKGNSVYYSFGKELKKNLDVFNIEKRSSLFMTLTAALKTLLFKYTGKEDIIIGTPVAGRNHPDLENQIGYYVNTLALRDQINSDKTFIELLDEIKKSAADSYTHQMYPFDKLVEEIKLPRDTSRSPLFDVMIVLQNFGVSYNGIFEKAEPYKIPMEISKYDLTFNFNDIGNDIELLIEYNTQLYKQERIEKIASHLFVLINQIIVNPVQSIKSINILSNEEENDLLHNLNNTAANYPADKTIIQLFEESALKYSAKPAVVYKEKKITYSELNDESNKIARYINGNYFISAGEAVGVLVSPSEYTVVILLAILKAGGAYVPIDPEYPDERINHILTESKTKVIITLKDNDLRLQKIIEENNINCKILNLEKINYEYNREDYYSRKVNINPDTTAYVIFTSGSTGKPKGCPITHRNLVRLFINDKTQYDFSSTDVWIMAHSYCFDFSVWEMYGALLFGGKLIIPERNEVRDIAAFVRTVNEHKVTVLNQTPGAFYKFVDTALDSKDNNKLNLRYVIFGGDKLNPQKLAKWVKKYSTNKVKLINMYGITETTIHVTYHSFTDEEILNSDGSSNIGRPLPETKVYIFDDYNMLAPVGVYGGIYVAGTGLSKGYLNRPDLTSERFIINPYNNKEILYKSGDVGRWNYDGTLEYLDRSDSQVQVRGFRVESAEIEIQLRQYQGITDAVVTDVDREGTKELAAYIVSGEKLKINKLKSFLSSSLPEYMIPSYFIKIDKIPLTPNGKLDKRLLPPAVQNIETGELFENPANKIEEELLELWQQVLSAEVISIHDNFFDIGGNSILLVKLHSKINEKFPDSLELTDLFSKSRISEQAEFIFQKYNSTNNNTKSIVEQNEVKLKHHDVAIIGIAARIGDCKTPDEFWNDLRMGVDFISNMPHARIKDIQELCRIHNINDDSLKFREYCYLNEVDKFDYSFFKLSPSEASLIDPGQRMFMETAYHAIEDAGYGGTKLWGSRTGVYIGASDNLGEYAKFIDSSDIQEPNLLLTALTPSILASRLSYHLNLKGPAMLVDTACSSSLVAVHLACQSLREGKIDSAIVGGIKLHLIPIDSGARLEIDSSDSRGHSFDDSANGTGGGEGVIAIMIKPLENALKDSDNIYAVIKGSEINQDGSSIGITAPDADAQADAIEKAWIDAGIDPLTVSFIETHGTATKLGDPVEVDGITKAFKKYTDKKSICAIGAVKANVGHLDTAAGLAGLLKAVLCLKYKQLTPLVHFLTPNRNIKFDESAAYINKELSEWKSNGSPLRCGVSSFGLSGTNCHIVLEEAPEINPMFTYALQKKLFVLSARNKESLLEYIKDIKKSLYSHSDTNPESICYTLATGRGHYSYRLAIVFQNVNELISKLSNLIINGVSSIESDGVYFNFFKITAANKKNIAADEITENEIRELSSKINLHIKNSADENDKAQLTAEAYVKGAEVKWEVYYCNSAMQKVSLPGYPFEKKRCWVKLKTKKEENKNVNTAYGKRYDNIFLNNCIVDTPAAAVYSNTFSNDDWLLNEHRIMGIPTLVGAAYLQIAYEAAKNHFTTEDIFIDKLYLVQPLMINEKELLEVITTVTKNVAGGLNIEIQSKHDNAEWQTYSNISVTKREVNADNKIDIEKIKLQMADFRKILHSDNKKLNDEIVNVGKKWNCLNKIYWNETEYLAELSVPEEDMDLAEAYYVYPPLVDAALSFAIDEPGYLPYSFGQIKLKNKIPKKIFSYITINKSESSETKSFNVTIADESGNIVTDVKNFTLKKITSKQNNIYHEMTWKQYPIIKQNEIVKSDILLLYNAECDELLVNDMCKDEKIDAAEIINNNFAEIFVKYRNKLPGKIIYLLPTDDNHSNSVESIEEKLENSLYSAFNFAKYISLNISSKIDLLIVGENVCEVSKTESYLNSLHNSVAGLGQVLQRECPNINCRFLDVDEFIKAIDVLDEINEGFVETYYYRACRNSKRYVREIKPVNIEEKISSDISVKNGGVYLITGGTGGIGLEIASYFAKQAKIKIALVNHNEFFRRNKWNEILLERKNEKLCLKIEKLIAIEKEAESVGIFSSDAGDYDKLKTTINEIKKEYGRIDGVIHAAGIAGKGFIFNKDIEQFREVVKPKIHGTFYLSELLKDDKPDFFLMASALTAIIPTSGQSDYTAANCFMDAYSAELNKNGLNAVSVNLTAWKETGMAYDYGVANDGIFKSILSLTGVNALDKIIKSKISSVILGEPDFSFLETKNNLPFYLDKNIRKQNRTVLKHKTETEKPKKISIKGRDSNSYSEYENTIAQIWATVLGYDEINITDNYYDLGGDSIHAIKINNLLEEQLKQPVTIADLFNHLTVEELAEYLEAKIRIKENECIADLTLSRIAPAAESNYYPVSSAQRRLFILDKLTKDKLSYHIPEIWNVKGKLNVDAIRKAFEKLIMRHEALRTSFDLIEDEPVQIIHSEIEFEIPLTAMNEENARNYIRKFIKPFDLGIAPLFRTEIIELSADNHLVLFDAHHIIIDAFSMEILKKEIFDLYEGNELEPLKIHYKDFSIWQNNYFKSSEAVEKKLYWINQFKNEIPVINLPVDYLRAANQSAEAGTYTLCIDEKLTAEVKKMSAEQGFSTFMILLAAYNIVLHKYTQQDDIIIGVTTIGRSNNDVLKLLGMFVNNLPVRSYPKDDQSIRQFLEKTKETTINAFANQDYPFDELIENLNIKRDLNRSPLFDVVFSYMNFELSEMKNDSLQITDYRAETILSSEYDLMLYGIEAMDKIFINVKYKKSLFKKESIERFAGHYNKTVDIITKKSDRKISDIDILLPDENEILKTFNNKYKIINEPTDAIDLLNLSFKAHNKLNALLFNHIAITYSQLEIKANKLANYLRSVHYVRPDELIGIMVERNDLMVVAMLGVMKSGAAYVGIDSSYPQERVDYILNDSKAKILITDKNIKENKSFTLNKATVVLDIDDEAINNQTSEVPEKNITFENLAYIIYTSGSTGNPKGVAITHKNLSTFLLWSLDEFKSTVHDIVYASTSYCFDLSVFEIFYSLSAGKTIRVLKSALDIPKYLGADNNVLINTVPSLVSTIKDDLDKGKINYISAINLAGEQISQTLIDGIDCDKIEVRNLYGPSEDTTYSTIYKFSNARKKVLIGCPISNTQIYIVDRNLKFVPIGHAGEICISGDGLAQGYLYKEELTKEKFIANPFGKGRLYRTGDLGKWHESGNIEYLGRIDRQVKIRGYRIELGEIETTIRRYQLVENAVVVAYEKGDNKDIVAYIVANNNLQIMDLKNYLSKILPSYMVPLYFVIIDRLPLTPNGKVDVKALPEPEIKSIDEGIIEPLNETEIKLAGIWKSVLNIDGIGKNDSFFDAGGHSLKALRLLSQINHEFKCERTLSDVFEHPTIAQFASLINRSKTKSLATLVPLPKSEYYDVSHAQKRLWILDRVEKKSIAYNIPIVYQINSAINITALESSFNAIIIKHESFRTYFVEADGEPKQKILEAVDFKIAVVELESSDNFINTVKPLIQTAIAEPFDLTKAPLINVTLIKNKTKDEHVLIINVHHIILDEWSINILMDNLAMFYDHFSGKNKINNSNIFLPQQVQYKEYAAWHNKLIEDDLENINVHKNYWLGIFKEPVKCIDMPLDFQRPKVQAFEGQTESFSLPEQLSEKLKKLSDEKNTTLFITTLALFNILFTKYTKQNDIVIGTPISNRDKPDIQDQIGFFLNTLALRNSIDANDNFNSFLEKVKANTLSAFNHQTYPFDMLVDELKLPRDLSRSPLFDVMLISQTQAGNEIKSASGLEMKAVEYDYRVSKFDLSISYYDDGNSIKYFFEYNTSLFKKERIVKMFCHFSSLIESVLANETEEISKLNIIPNKEKDDLFILSFGADKTLSNKSIVSLIEMQAEAFKNEIAVTFKRKKLTYTELNIKANQLAHYLVENKDIKRNEFICVMLDRSEWSVIAMLAVLKAGGVYIPVDPNYPLNRIEYILQDSGGKLLITSGKYEKLTSLSKNRIINVDEVENDISNCGKNNMNINIEINSDNAYVIYTSGSTGKPKGVLGTHKCLLNLIEWQSDKIESRLKLLQFAPHSFDVSVQEILFSLASAGTLYMIENEMRYKMTLVAELIEKEKIEVLTMPYSTLNLFLGETENYNQLKSLKHIITSGEQPFVNSTILKMLRQFPSLMFHNQYGPSETHVVTSKTICGNTDKLPVKIPIGKPINNTQVFLLDDNMELVPVGFNGNLYIGGFNVANGYINKIEYTSERFIANPFGDGCLYKSGDVARWNYDGELEFVGRDDGQVKVRGFRIELGEIESCMLQYPDLKEAAVKLIGEEGNREIAAYYSCSTEIDITKLKEYMKLYLPNYMIPGYFVKIKKLPQTPSGKIDLLSLPMPSNNDNLFTSVFTEPEGETEIAISEVWKEVLNIRKISSDNNFFEIGGNSIKAIQVMSKVQKRLGKKTYLNLIFQHPTIKQMADIIIGTDERLKNLESNYIMLKSGNGKKLFFLPPGIGYSFAYLDYAKYFDDYSLFGLNFIETNNPAVTTADTLTDLQKEGAFYLFGHSAGGNMAYDVAIELLKRGREIGGIIFLDTYRQLELIDWSEEEYLNDAVLYIEQNHAEFLDEEIKDAALKKIVAYRKYLNARAEAQKINCPIIQIEAAGELIKFKHKISRRAWDEITPHFEVVEGYGGHMDMLKQPYLEKNALLTKQLFDRLINK